MIDTLPNDPKSLKQLLVESLDRSASLSTMVSKQTATIATQRATILEQTTAMATQRATIAEQSTAMAARDTELERRCAELQAEREKSERLTRKAEKLQHRLEQLLRARYGPRAERLHPGQGLLFDDLAPDHAVELPTAKTTAPRKRKGHGRRRLPEDLRVVEVHHTVPDDERACPDCGTQRRAIGDERSRQLEYEPAKVYIVEHIREKLACPCCEAQVTTAEKPAQPIDKGLPGPGLLAAIIVSKYGDHTPLYRQEKILKRHGIHLPRSTMCAWMRMAGTVQDPPIA